MCGGGGDTRVREPESQLALAEQAAINYNRYRSIFVPLEDQFMETTMETFNDQNYANVGGQASTRIAGLYEDGMQDFARAARNRGIDPSSGAYQSESNALRTAMARGMGTGSADVQMGNTDQGLAGMTAIIRSGQGLANETMQGQIGLAEDNLRRATSEANLDFQNSSSLANVMGTGAGIAAGYTLPAMQRYG